MMKRALSILSICILFLSACSGGGAPSGGGASSGGDSNEIIVWAWDPAFNIAALEVAKEFYAAKNPDVNVKIVEYAQDDIIQKLNTGLNSGTTRGLPNVVLIEDYRAQSFLQSYPDAFYELTDYIDPADFAEYKIGPTSVDGKQYGVPFDTGVSGLYIRTDALEQAGIALEELQDLTWDEFIEVGKKIKEATGKAVVSMDPNNLEWARMMVQSAGTWYTKEDGVTPNIAGNEALASAFQVYKKLIEANIVKFHTDWSQFVANFNSGEVMAILTGNWITPSVKAEASQSGKWAVVPVPKLADIPNAGHATNLGGSSWYVLNIDGKEAAADFLAQTFGSDAAMYEKLVDEIGAIGTLKAAYESGAYQKTDEFFGGQSIVSDFAAWAEEIPNVNYGMHTYAIDDILVVEMQNYLNGKSLEDALNDAQATAETQIR